MIICGVTLLALRIFLRQTFEMNDLGKLNYFPGLKVFSSINGYYLSQVKYSFNLLSKFGLIDNKTIPSPRETNAKLIAYEGCHFLLLVGSLFYLTITWHVIPYIIIYLVNQFMATPRSTNYIFGLRIMCYVRGHSSTDFTSPPS